MEFQNKIAFITGAAAGFGEAFARLLAAKGTKVILADIDIENAQNVASDIVKNGGQAIAIKCDVSDESSINSVFEEVKQNYDGLDILINNAGLHSEEFSKGFAELGSQKTKKLFDVNVFGLINCSIAARPLMVKKGGGVIINISSIAAFANVTSYGVSKLAVRGITISLANEFANDNIRVNAIAPGLIATDKIKGDFPPSFFDDFANNLQKIHRTGEVKDIENAMLFLCSDQSSFVTGETLKISGGYPLGIY